MVPLALAAALYTTAGCSKQPEANDAKEQSVGRHTEEDRSRPGWRLFFTDKHVYTITVSERETGPYLIISTVDSGNRAQITVDWSEVPALASAFEKLDRWNSQASKDCAPQFRKKLDIAGHAWEFNWTGDGSYTMASPFGIIDRADISKIHSVISGYEALLSEYREAEAKSKSYADSLN